MLTHQHRLVSQRRGSAPTRATLPTRTYHNYNGRPPGPPPSDTLVTLFFWCIGTTRTPLPRRHDVQWEPCPRRPKGSTPPAALLSPKSIAVFRACGAPRHTRPTGAPTRARRKVYPSGKLCRSTPLRARCRGPPPTTRAVHACGAPPASPGHRPPRVRPTRTPAHPSQHPTERAFTPCVGARASAPVLTDCTRLLHSSASNAPHADTPDDTISSWPRLAGHAHLATATRCTLVTALHDRIGRVLTVQFNPPHQSCSNFK